MPIASAVARKGGIYAAVNILAGRRGGRPAGPATGS